jgi:bacterioferritin (cytochrome b1)
VEAFVMGFDLDRSEAAESTLAGPDESVFSRALSRNLLAERFAIDAYREIAERGQHYDQATLRLVKVALAVEEEHAQILCTIIENLRNLNGALAG